MGKLAALLVFMFATSANADTLHVDKTSGAFVDHQGLQCHHLRDTVLAIVQRCTLSLTVTSTSISAWGTPDDSIVTDFGAWAFWRAGKQTVVISVRPKRGTTMRALEVSMIERSGDTVCYEKWKGLASAE